MNRPGRLMVSPQSHSQFITQLRDGLAQPWAEENFDALALTLFRLQFQSVEPYRTFCLARHATLETVRSWREIPAVPTQAFKEFDVTSLDPKQRDFVFRSSGTSQEIPSQHFHDRESLRLYERSLLPWFNRSVLAGLDPGGFGLLILTPDADAAPNSSLVHMFETVRTEFGFGRDAFVGRISKAKVWELAAESVLDHLRCAIEARRPLLVLGPALAFLDLIEVLEARELRFRLPIGSRLFETGGYKSRSRALSKPELYQVLTQRLGVPTECIVSEYGMTELSSQAYDQIAGTPVSEPAQPQAPPPPRLFRFPPWVRVRMVSPETEREACAGETGLIQVFDLANVRSVMAIQTSDLGRARADGFELIGRAQHADLRGCSLAAR